MIEPSSELWDYLAIGDQRSPGVVRLSGNDLKIGWDIQNPQGAMGGVTRRIGEPIKEFDAEFYLTNETDAEGWTDFDRWDPFQRMLEAAVAPGKKPYALDVYHPDLARVRITAVTIGSIGAVVLDGKGGGTIKVHFLEYRPPKPLGTVALTKTEGDAKIEQVLADINKAWELPGEGKPTGAKSGLWGP